MLEKNGENREIIWIDLDETLCYTVREVLEHHKLTIWDIIAREEHITDYYLNNVPWINVENQETAVHLFREVYFKDLESLDISPIYEAHDKIKEIQLKWYDTHIVTARDSTILGEYTKSWLDKHFPEMFEQIHHANHMWAFGNAIPKSKLCKQNWISIMIEDNLDYALELTRNGIKTYLLHKPWNYKRDEKHELLKRVEHWWEIEI